MAIAQYFYPNASPLQNIYLSLFVNLYFLTDALEAGTSLELILGLTQMAYFFCKGGKMQCRFSDRIIAVA